MRHTLVQRMKVQFSGAKRGSVTDQNAKFRQSTINHMVQFNIKENVSGQKTNAELDNVRRTIQSKDHIHIHQDYTTLALLVFERSHVKDNHITTTI